MGTEIEKIHWQQTLEANEGLIIQNKIQIEIAKEVIKHAKKKLKEFPEEETPSVANKSENLS